MDDTLLDAVARAIIRAKFEVTKIPLTEKVWERLTYSKEIQAMAKSAIEAVHLNECCDKCKSPLLAPAYCTGCAVDEAQDDFYGDFSVRREAS